MATVEQAKAVAEKEVDSDATKPASETSPSTDAESIDGSVVDVTTVAKLAPKVVTRSPPAFTEPFAPNIGGLEEARLSCRFMMNRIVQEVNFRKFTCEQICC